jgi:hypothetical protein
MPKMMLLGDAKRPKVADAVIEAMFASFRRHYGHRNLHSDVIHGCHRADEGRIVACLFTKSQLEG